MGKNGGTLNSRSHLAEFPRNVSQAKKIWRRTNRKLPVIKHRWATKGKPAAIGRVWKIGMTPEEELMRIAPDGSAPERILYGWLVVNQVPFTFQEPVLGGRVPGGAVIDFVLYASMPPIAIRVQSYWHTKADQIMHDEVQLAILIELGYSVEDVWEYEINTIDKVQNKMTEILYGSFRRVGG